MKQHDLIIIGAGPGGYVAAIRGAQLGLDVACVDENPELGGTCLRIGCIPSKALLESSEKFAEAGRLAEHGVKIGDAELDLGAMMARKDKVVQILTRGVKSLFKKNKVMTYQGRGRLAGAGAVVVEGNQGSVEISGKNVILATGTRPAALPGVEIDNDRIGSSTECLAYDSVPEHLVVIGAGYIGLELGSVWSRLGSRVTVLEYLDRILPGTDAQMAREALKLFKAQGMQFELGRRVTGARAEGDHCIVESEDSEPITCDRVLVAVGRAPCTDDLGLDSAGVELDDKGYVVVGDGYATNVPGIFAIGDIAGGPQLAHKAEEEGIACVEKLVTGYGHVNYDAIPAVVYTHPELASVGKTEEALKEAGVDYKKGTFPFRANGRARSLGDIDGQVKILADAGTDRILGVHILGPRAGDLIAEAVAAMEFSATAEDIARTSHAHPTLAEVIKEAAMAVDGRAIHV